MAQCVVLRLQPSSQPDGEIQVWVELGAEGQARELDDHGTLSCDRILLQRLEEWRSSYQGLTGPHREIRPKSIHVGGPIRHQRQLCQHSEQALQQQFHHWLNAASFRRVRDLLLANLNRQEEIRFILRTDDDQLRRLPWHNWELLQHYDRAEVVLGATRAQRRSSDRPKDDIRPVRILAVLGSSEGLDIDLDLHYLTTFSPEAEVHVLTQPSRTELQAELCNQPWDIFFFAGHSYTQGKQGVIALNDQDQLSLKDLTAGLRQAIDQGLEIAIFNSCDGLGLARDLEQLHIPQLIVMREPVPDQVAQQFLQNLLPAYSSGLPLHLAVRDAREKLRILENEYPCASSLPILCQNPNAPPPPTWHQLRTGGRIAGSNWESPSDEIAAPSFAITATPQPQNFHKIKVLLKQVALVLGVSLSVTTLIFGIRWMGGFQGAELHSFDHLMRHRPIERADERLLIVGATTEDLYTYGLNNSIRDEVFVELIDYLQTHGARVIGFNTLRDLPVSQDPVMDEGNVLFAKIRDSENLISNCYSGEDFEDSAAPPLGAERVGFSDLFLDSSAGDRTATIRRYLISRSVNRDNPQASRCETETSFALYVAHVYLAQEVDSDVHIQPISTEDGKGVWQVGSHRLSGWSAHQGGYQKLDDRGWQVVVNYRNLPPQEIESVGRTVSIGELLDESQQAGFNPEWIRDRAVLIGTTSIQVDSKHPTPLGRMSGLSIQAHMVSDLISTAFGERIPIWGLKPWQDFIWMLTWACFSVTIATRKQRIFSILMLVVANILAIGLMAQLALSFSSLWVPLVPTIATSTVSILVTKILLESEFRKRV